MAYPPVVIVDEQDSEVGLAMLKDAEAQGLLFRVVAVAVLDENGRILLQKRSSNMSIDPGTWDISAGGHVDEGLTYDTAAQLELSEELGISGRTPQVTGKRLHEGRCFLQMYKLVVPADIQLQVGAHEVADVKWFTPDEFAALLRDDPEHCAAFLKAINGYDPALFGLEAVGAHA